MDKTKIAVNVFDKHANTYQDKFMDVSLYGDTLNSFCDRINKSKASILDIACGPGNITKYLLTKQAAYKVLGIDLAPNMIKLARENNPDAGFKRMDCRHIATFETNFDGIMCGFCLPYLEMEEAVKLIKDAYGLLNSRGVFYLSTMEGDYTTSGFRKGSSGDEIFMHYYPEDFLVSTLKNYQFKNINVQRKEYPAQDGTLIVDIILIAEK